MKNKIGASDLLEDGFGRHHNYLRLSLTDKCNLRCTYCMPSEGMCFTPNARLMQPDEILKIASLFVSHGVTKIRLTGGEPLVRRDFGKILEMLHTLPVRLSITTNGVLVDRFVDDFTRCELQQINFSLDTLQAEKYFMMTRRDRFDTVLRNLYLLIDRGFDVKVNCVLIKGVNEDEVIDFIELTRDLPIAVRFIEFMPFDGNHWDTSLLVTQEEIVHRVDDYYPASGYQSLPLESNFTARNFAIRGWKGNFGIISSMTNPFCSTCNRIRLTADGKIKNCLFSHDETDLLQAFRRGDDIESLIAQTIVRKKAVRAGMNSFHKIRDHRLHSQNRSMIAIGG